MVTSSQIIVFTLGLMMEATFGVATALLGAPDLVHQDRASLLFRSKHMGVRRVDPRIFISLLSSA